MDFYMSANKIKFAIRIRKLQQWVSNPETSAQAEIWPILFGKGETQETGEGRHIKGSEEKRQKTELASHATTKLP